MGAVYPAICGQVLSGQTLCGTWRTTWDKPQLVLKAGTFSITITEGPVIALSVNRPLLYLNAKPFTKQTDTRISVGRPLLQLKGKPYVIQPFIGLSFNKPRLLLFGKAVALSTSAQLQFGRPLLVLVGGRLARVGVAGLIPTVPGEITLTPSPDQSENLVPTTPGSAILVASAEGAVLLVPTEDNPDVLLVPTHEEVR